MLLVVGALLVLLRLELDLVSIWSSLIRARIGRLPEGLARVRDTRGRAVLNGGPPQELDRLGCRGFLGLTAQKDLKI